MRALEDIVNCLHYKAPGGKARALLVMLPGVGIEAVEFADQGMVAAAHERGLALDIVTAHPDLDLYLEDGVTEALHRAVVEPARARGCTRIWLLGISLGAMGALLYASAYPADVEGLVLLAPFLGTRGTVAEMARAGGLNSWSAASSIATAPEQRMLIWLQAHLAERTDRPSLYLGYGRQDRFAAAHRMLAKQLPRERVAVADGGHDWPSWVVLWKQLLDRLPFAAQAGAAGPCKEQ